MMANESERDMAMLQTVDHTKRVAALLADVMHNIAIRAAQHDRSKFTPEEWPLFVDATAKLKGLTYGSDEYRQALAELKPSLDHHYANNSHHPEHYAQGVEGMDLIDLIEMLADWKAATERHANGSLSKSLEINRSRFHIGPQLEVVLRNTAQRFGWLESEADHE